MPQSYWTPAEKASPEYKNALDAINEYMELSQQQEDSDVKYFASLSEKQFLDTIQATLMILHLEIQCVLQLLEKLLFNDRLD